MQAAPAPAQVLSAIDRRSFCTLATASPDGRPHVAAVLYVATEDVLYVSTRRTSRKARNIEANPLVHVCVPVRRVPVGPPSSIQFDGTAEVLGLDDGDVVRLAAAKQLKAITGHGELDLPDGCFLRITPARTLHTYGIGLPLRHLIRDPLHAAGRVSLS